MCFTRPTSSADLASLCGNKFANGLGYKVSIYNYMGKVKLKYQHVIDIINKLQQPFFEVHMTTYDIQRIVYKRSMCSHLLGPL